MNGHDEPKSNRSPEPTWAHLYPLLMGEILSGAKEQRGLFLLSEFTLLPALDLEEVLNRGREFALKPDLPTQGGRE